MKKLVSLIILLLLLLGNVLSLKAKEITPNGTIDIGKYATYKLYYKYEELDTAYKGQHRLTLAVYNFERPYIKPDSITDIIDSPKKIYTFYNERKEKWLSEIFELFPTLKTYQKNIDYQIYCHILGETTFNSQKEWDLEVQRRQNNYGLIGEIKYQCNAADWDDNKLLFHPDVKFHGQLPYPNQWISYQKNDKPIYYYVGEEYVGVTGWKFVDAWYYFNDFAVMQTGWLSYNNKWYYLHESGRMLTGVRWIGENYYALDSVNGDMKHSGWIEDNGNWYYSHDTGGSLLRNTWYKIDGSYYYFNNDATMKKGWLKYNNYWYFLQDNGVMATGWKDIGESRYYFKTSGEMLTGVHVIGGIEYEFNSSGHLIRTGKKVNINPCDKYTCIYPYEDPTTVEEGER